MRLGVFLCMLILLAPVVCVSGHEMKAYQLKEHYGAEPLYDCVLGYYYTIPCPEDSWFWALTDLRYGDRVGAWFELGDVSMVGSQACDPQDCHVLDQFRVMNLEQRIIYPKFAEFEIYCSDEQGCPVGPPLWESDVITCWRTWTVIPVDPPLVLCDCAADQGPPPSSPRILIIATSRAPYGDPDWGLDNISTSVASGHEMHDNDCAPALYPRPLTSHYPTIHSGYYGKFTWYCPPERFKDPGDPTPDGSQYGYLELAWSLYITCSGPTQVYATTWGSLKALYE